MAQDNERYEKNYTFQKKPWKVWMSSAPNPTAVLVSARQLLEGTSLGHNILIYNGNLYANGVFSGTSFLDFYRYCLDVEPALFDRRSKFGTYEYDLGTSLNDILHRSEITVNLHNKDAALYPEDIKAFFGVNSTWAPWFHKNSNMIQDNFGVSYNAGDCFTAEATNQEISYANLESDIICYQKDDIFSNTMAFEDGKVAYTKIQLNQRKTMVMKLIVGAILLNSNEPSLITEINDQNVTAVFTKFSNDDKTNHLFDYIYFWVKAPFCADYIDPDDFNQNLNQDADVVHRNLLIASQYVDKIRNNFNRFNEAFDYQKSEDEDTSSLTEFLEQFSRPYIPTNSPLKDFVSNKLLGAEAITDYDYDEHSNVVSTAEELIRRSYIMDEKYEIEDIPNANVLGSVYSLPVRKVNGELQRITPFNFYDPDSREDSEYYRLLGRLPTLIGKEGNITTDGRIMSPTIDELWYIVKKIISGEPLHGSIPSNIALPNNEVAEDTTLKEAIMAQYKQSFDGVSKAIDPIDFAYEYDENGKINKVSVKEFVVQPENITHKIYTLLAAVSARLNKFYNENVALNDDFTTDEESGIVTYTGNSRALNRVGDYILGTTKMETASNADNEYGPRASAPLSLRELEAAILGNKYNIENNFVFASKTYAVTGKFGKRLEDEEHNITSGGSLYQMHRDYNADVENPNTYFELGGKKDGTSGYDITAGDLNGEQEVNTEGPGVIPVYILDKNLKITSEINKTQLPIMASNYGASELLHAEQGKYTGADVYMAADGTWRYKAEHMRLPILRSRY